VKKKKMIRMRKKGKSQRIKRRSKLLHQKTNLPRAILNLTKRKKTKMKIKMTKKMSLKKMNRRILLKRPNNRSRNKLPKN